MYSEGNMVTWMEPNFQVLEFFIKSTVLNSINFF